MCSLQRLGLPRSSSGALEGSEVGTCKGLGLLFPFTPSQADKGQLTACGHSRAGRGRGVYLWGGAFTHFLLWVGGEKLALVTRSRLGLQLLTQQGITVAVNLYRHRTQQ